MIWKRQKDFFFDALLLEAIGIGFTAKKFTYIMSIMYLFVSGNGEKWNKIEFPSGEKYNFFKNMWNANRWFWCNGEKKTLLSAHFKLNDLKVINCEANVLMGKSISER